MQSLLPLVLFVVFASHVSATMQNVTVQGIAVCNKRRFANAHVKLYDRDTIDPNDLLSDIHTNNMGEFKLYGEEDEVGSIEPFVRIHHNCNAKKGCTRISDYTVPKEYIGELYDMTYVTLDIVVHGEKEVC